MHRVYNTKPFQHVQYKPLLILVGCSLATEVFIRVRVRVRVENT